MTMPPEYASADGGGEELARVMRALTTLSAVNRALIGATDEEALLRDICRAIVVKGGYRMAWVAYAMHDEHKSIRPVAHWGFEAGFLAPETFDRFRRSWADDGRGRHGLAITIRTGQVTIGQNLQSDPLYPADLREDARERGYASAIRLPLRVKGEVLGALLIYAPETDAFDKHEVELLGEAADDLAFGIDTLRVRLRHEQAEETIRRMLHYDTLTGLPNRACLTMRLEEALGDAKRQNKSLAVLMLGLDRFREINETLGYRQGDALLGEVAARLLALVGDRERTARAGEAEFAVLLPAANAAAATDMARRILSAVREPVALSGLRTHQRASLGIAMFPGHGGDGEVLMRRANLAMQQARLAGQGVALYSGGLDEECTRRLALIGDLHRAIERDELALYCQPKVHLASGRICGAEALVRWQHADLGAVSPTRFVELAERSGLISPLTDWVLQAALRQSYAWHEAGIVLPLAVNLSASDLQDGDLLERIDGLFSTWGAGRDWVQFELTESAVMEDPRVSLARLGSLKERGCRLYIDDFGTGYSSLAYLRQLPIDAIKIDRCFVADMLDNRDCDVIVRSTIDLAHHLNLEVVAEGVENPQVQDRLAEEGCDVVQGYAISEPMPAEQFGHWLQQCRWPH